jgi:uncharacterized phage protein gp47/JayE
MIEINNTDEQNAKALLDDIPDSYQKTVGYFAWDFCLAVSKGALSAIYALIKYIVNLFDFANWDLSDLKILFPNLRNVTYKDSSFSSGFLTATGSCTITAGDLFQTTSGLQFEASTTADVTDGGIFEVKCQTAGSVGNVPAGTITVIPATISGLTAVTNKENFTNGYDEEGKASYIARFIEDVQKPITSGNAYNYEKFAKECVGVGNAKCKPLWNGDNTVKIVILNSNYEIADNTLIKTVQDYIDPYTLDSDGNKIGWGCGNGKAPIGAYCTVVSADKKDIKITVEIELKSGETLATVAGAIKANVTTYFKSIMFVKDAYVSYAKIGQAILSTDGVMDYKNLKINDGVNNIELADTNLSTEIPVISADTSIAEVSA